MKGGTGLAGELGVPARSAEYRREYRKCNAARRREYERERYHRLPNKRKRLRKNLVRRYGLKPEEYQALLAKQNGVCAICKQAETALKYGQVQNLSVDHCHETDKVRGLLCNNCNRLLGWAKDDSLVLRACADYLEAHR